MDVTSLLTMFQLIADPDRMPVSQAVVAVSAKLTRDLAVYDDVAEQAFARFALSAERDDELAYGRIESILRALLNVDGRSELGCLRLALLAHENHCGELGVNSLAALANHFRTADHLALPESVLIAALEPLTVDDDLGHNAFECIRILTRRSRAP